MPFTDDDLNRWKNLASGVPQPHDILEKTVALLARLEAAEKIVNRMCVHAGPCRGKLDDCFKDDVQAWRKAAGK